MTTWTVTNRITGVVIHAYTADAPYPFEGLEFDTCNHIPVVEVEPAPLARRLSKLEYMQRFTDAELEGIYSAAKVSTAVEVWLAKFNAASVDADGTSIDLDDPRTVAGVNALESVGLIGVGRAAEVLA